jgi:hypothetical protein
MLNETDILPDGLLEANATELLDLLGTPTLIHLQGEKPEVTPIAGFGCFRVLHRD